MKLSQLEKKTIPRVQDECKELAEDLSETRKKFIHFNTRFDHLESAQVETVMKQDSGFNRLEVLLCGWIGELTPNNPGQVTSSHQMEVTVIAKPRERGIDPVAAAQSPPHQFHLSPIFESPSNWTKDMENHDLPDT